MVELAKVPKYGLSEASENRLKGRVVSTFLMISIVSGLANRSSPRDKEKGEQCECVEGHVDEIVATSEQPNGTCMRHVSIVLQHRRN